MASDLKCVFCAVEKTDKVNFFSKDTLKKCQYILRLRKLHKLKYGSIILPDEIFDSGYHSQCYKSFTALKRKFFETKTRVSIESSHAKPSSSSTESNQIFTSSSADSPTRESVEKYAGPCFSSSSTDLNQICMSSSANSSNVTENLSYDSSLTAGDVHSISFNDMEEIEQHLKPQGDKSVLECTSVSTKEQCDSHEEVIIQEDNVCFFCLKSNKKIKGNIVALHATTKDEFEKSALRELENNSDLYNETLFKLQILNKNEVYYHKACQTKFNNEKMSLKRNPERKRTSWHTFRENHQIVFEEVCNLIEENVIERGRCYFLSYLYKQYHDSFKEANDMQDTLDLVISRSYFEEKLSGVFADRIKIMHSNNRKVIAPAGITYIDEALFTHLKDEDILRAAASILRKEIMGIEKAKLPDNLTSQRIIQGECSVPPLLSEFVASVIGGPARKRRNCNSFQRHVSSLTQDLIYVTHNGNIKTSKHICLGMTLKSLTSCRKVVDIMNRYGHCVSYNAVEELETEATYTSTTRAGLCPETINKTKNLSVGVAFDNFDRFVDTKSGKDTLHDTVGIIYQNVDTTKEANNEDFQEVFTNQRRRRSYEAIEPELPFAPKRLKMSVGFQPETVPDNGLISNQELYNQIDTVWMMSHAVGTPNIPMWVGFNSMVIEDESPQQLISYLSPINASPTAIPVVLETMNQCVRIHQELNQPYIQVTYDLAIAKIALQLQANEAEKFSKLFIHLGAFHIMLSYFKAVGKVIDGCGLSTIMVESGLIASGSVSSFIDAKHFNRCKRLHPLMALGLQVLHFRSFLDAENIEISEDIVQELERLQSCKTPHFVVQDEELKDLCSKYSTYEEKTIKGEFGKTAQFYMVYVKLVQHFLTLSRSIRVGDFELFKNVLPKVANLFFACNHQNYARWTVKYHYNLTKVAETHPGLEEDFKSGFFGIKRTAKPFSRQPVDLTLEQTINADAARRLTGIVHLTDSISARQRWARSHDIRSSVISHVLEEIGMEKKQDVSAELQPSNVKKSSEQLGNFIKSFEQYINPFSRDLPEGQLFNIASGKAAMPQVDEFLINVEEIGKDRRETFITECSLDINRFEKPIKKTKVLNFSSEMEKKTVKIGGKDQEIKIQRDLFGRMLGISMDHKIDVHRLLSYPITPVPLALCHLDGAVCKTAKSVLAKCLESNVDHNPPEYTDVYLLDGFSILHSMKEVPKTFGNISKRFLQMILKYPANRIDVIFDQYWHPSIKDHERNLRNEASLINYSISGADQVRPTDFSKEMKNTNFKEALIDFFSVHWASDEVAPFIGNKVIHLNFRDCRSYKTSNGQVESTVVEDLCCNLHEEADTKIIHHACQIVDQSNIVIKASDTDILIIMLGNMEKLKHDLSHIWMLTGTGNNERFIDINEIYDQLGELLAKSLIGFHAFTGCDFNPAFLKKGKKRPFNLLKQNVEFQQAFAMLGDLSLTENQLRSLFETIQKFTCQMYNTKKSVDVDDGRFELFVNSYKTSDINESFLKKVKTFDASSIPPCKRELYQQFLRAHYISSIWKNASQKQLTTLDPLECGWTKHENSFVFKWFQGDQLPCFVSDLIDNSEETDDENLSTNEFDTDIEDDTEL